MQRTLRTVRMLLRLLFPSLDVQTLRTVRSMRSAEVSPTQANHDTHCSHDPHCSQTIQQKPGANTTRITPRRLRTIRRLRSIRRTNRKNEVQSLSGFSTIAAMCSGQSLCLVATAHGRFSLFVAFVGSASGQGCCPAQAPQSCRLGCLPFVVIAHCGNTLRFYITPHCIKCMASQSPSSFGGHAPLSRPVGLTQQALCKVAYAGSGRQLSALPGRWRALRTATCRPVGAPAWWLHSGALRSVFSQRLRRVMGVGPRPPLALACFASIACAVCPSAPQGGSLRTAPKQHHAPSLLCRTLRFVKHHAESWLPPPNGGCRSFVCHGVMVLSNEREHEVHFCHGHHIGQYVCLLTQRRYRPNGLSR